MQVADMMRQIVITTTADRSLAQAQQRLQEHRVRHLPVVAQTHLIGLLTDRDVRQASASRLPQLAAATRATSSAPSMLAADGQDLHPQV